MNVFNSFVNTVQHFLEKFKTLYNVSFWKINKLEKVFSQKTVFQLSRAIAITKVLFLNCIKRL